MKVLYLKPKGHGVLQMMLFFAAVLLVFGFASAASAKGVATDTVKPAGVQSGTYDLITSGSPAPIAILKKEGAAYDIKLATAGSTYKVTSGLTEDQAIKTANDFLKKDSAVLNTDVKEIKGPDGSVIGYEMTPVNRPLRWGSLSNIATTSYKASGDKVWAYVIPDPLYSADLMGAG